MTDQTSVTGTAVTEIATLAQRAAAVQRFTIAGREFADRGLARIDVDPKTPTMLEFFTLAGFAAFLKAENETVMVHVVSPTSVVAVSGLGGIDRHLRRALAQASCRPDLKGFRFNQYEPLTDLSIALQTCFVPGEGQVRDLQQFCAAVRATQEIGVDDDGVSQTVQARRGVAAVQEARVNNPWLLAPWRTFAEVPQPASPFVLRFVKEEGELPEAGLFETGDSYWQVRAVRAIADVLQTLLGPDWKVLG